MHHQLDLKFHFYTILKLLLLCWNSHRYHFFDVYKENHLYSNSQAFLYLLIHEVDDNLLQSDLIHHSYDRFFPFSFALSWSSFLTILCEMTFFITVETWFIAYSPWITVSELLLFWLWIFLVSYLFSKLLVIIVFRLSTAFNQTIWNKPTECDKSRTL